MEQNKELNKVVALFGATGKTGIILTKKLLEKEFKVKALVRSPEKLMELKDRIEIIKGSIEESDKVDEVIKNSDAVISVIGHVKGTPANMQRDAAKSIVKSMVKYKVERLIALTGSGVFAEGDTPGILDKLMTRLIKTVAKQRFQDGVNYTEEIKNSGLDWTVVRAPILTNAPAKGNYKIGMVGAPGMSIRISREDLSNFIIELIDSSEYIKKLPSIG